MTIETSSPLQQQMKCQGPTNSLFAKLAKIEESILSLFLLVMILLTCTQIILRTFFSSGISWADPFLRYLVLWTGFLGAAMATSQGKHIAMDVMGFLVPEYLKAWLRILTNLFSAVVAGFLTWAAYLFIQSEVQYGGSSLLGIPSWGWSLIFPIAFSLICLRFLMAVWAAAREIIHPQESSKSSVS